MAGREVYRGTLDQKAADTVLSVRRAFDDVDAIFEWLATHPSNASEGDILTMDAASGGFGYTADEAYVIRYTFESLHGLNIQPILDTGRKLTGLE